MNIFNCSGAACENDEYIEQLEAENKKMREALSHYAKEETWINSECCTGDRWEIARQTLKEIKEG